MMYYTTLNRLEKIQPCPHVWEKLLTHLGKTCPDNELVSLLKILETLGINDTIWALHGLDDKAEDAIRIFTLRRALQFKDELKENFLEHESDEKIREELLDNFHRLEDIEPYLTGPLFESEVQTCSQQILKTESDNKWDANDTYKDALSVIFQEGGFTTLPMIFQKGNFTIVSEIIRIGILRNIQKIRHGSASFFLSHGYPEAYKCFRTKSAVILAVSLFLEIMATFLYYPSFPERMILFFMVLFTGVFMPFRVSHALSKMYADKTNEQEKKLWAEIEEDFRNIFCQPDDPA